jgi:hypothetical protein
MNLDRILEKYPNDDCRRIDLMIGEKSLWGLGLGTEAIRLLTDLAFEREKADLVFGCEVADYNPASQKAFMKNGYEIDAVIIQPPGDKAKECFDLKKINPSYSRHRRSRRGEKLTLRDELLSMKEEDVRVRAELAADGSLFDGYHPRMEDVHRRNAARLQQIIDEHGWPGKTLVGEDGAEAAWLIAQHAIGEPDFQRSCLKLLKTAADVGEVPAWQPAYLEDRIRVFEGRPQIYATQFDIGDDGLPIPYEIDEPDSVDERRRAVGLEPLAEQIGRAERVDPPTPEMRAKRDREYREWLRRVGWRE